MTATVPPGSDAEALLAEFAAAEPGLSDAARVALGVTLLEGCERLAAHDAVTGAGYEPTPERVQAEVDRRRQEEHALYVRQQVQALMDESPEVRAYRARFMAEVEARLREAPTQLGAWRDAPSGPASVLARHVPEAGR